MTRFVPAAVLLGLLSTPAPLVAQTLPSAAAAQVPVQFTIGVTSASVYKFPTMGSPVIGQAPRGMVLPVTRELGSWVRVPWEGGESGVAYLHVSTGAISRGGMTTSRDDAPAGVFAQATTAMGATLTNPEDARRQTPARDAAPSAAGVSVETAGYAASQVQLASRAAQYVPPPTHTVGIGPMIGFSNRLLGGSARIWAAERVGVQFQLSHERAKQDQGTLSSIVIGPSVVVSMRDVLTDYLSLRPYVGGGPLLYRHSFNAGPGADAESDSGFGIHVFGGGEVTFAALPQVGFSAGLGYRTGAAFSGFDPAGLNVAAAAHWYFR